ncbi:MAG: hypothetical protein AB3N14_18630 [Flavobacteriaceae bacterium]
MNEPKKISDFMFLENGSKVGLVTNKANLSEHLLSISKWATDKDSLLLVDEHKNPILSFISLDHKEMLHLSEVSKISLALTDARGEIIDAYLIERA